MMPPPRRKKKLTAAQKELLKRWIAEGAEYQPHWSFIAPQRPNFPAVKNGLGAQSDRRFILAEAGKERPAAGARGRSPHAGAAAEPRSDGPAAAARRSRGIRQRQVADCLREIRRQAAEVAALGRASRPLLARRGPLRRHHGIHIDNYREIWPYRDWVIEAFNRNMPFDQFTIEQLAGDLLPNRTLDQQMATGFNRCNITTNEGGAIPEEYLVLYTRDRTETTAAGLAGADGRLRRLPRSQIRSARAARVLRAVGVLQQHHAGGDGRQHHQHAAGASWCRGRKTGRAGKRLTKEIGRWHEQLEARKKAARADFDKWLASAKSGQVAAQFAIGWLALARPAERGQGQEIATDRGTASRGKLTSTPDSTWDAGHVAAKAFADPTGSTSSCPKPAISKRIRHSPCRRLGQDSQGATDRRRVARMDDEQQLSRLGPVARMDRIGTAHHQPLARRCGQSRWRKTRSAQTWYHVFVTYDGSRQGRRREASTSTASCSRRGAGRQAAEHDPHRSAVEDRPADTGDRLARAALQDVRIYDRALAPRSRAAGQGDPRAPGCLPSRPTSAHAAEKNELFDWWLVAWTIRLPGARRRSWCDCSRKNRDPSARHGRPRHDRSAPNRRWPTCCIAANTTSAATRCKPATPQRLAADAGRFAAETASASPNGCCGPTSR